MTTVAWEPPDRGMRGITDASTTHNPGDALDPAVLIHHRHGVGIRAHLTGPRHMPGGSDSLAYPAIQRLIVSENSHIPSDFVVNREVSSLRGSLIRDFPCTPSVDHVILWKIISAISTS
jgi:hypothetical protein